MFGNTEETFTMFCNTRAAVCVRISRRLALGAMAAVFAAGSMVGLAQAQAFPERPINIVVAFPPGSTMDVLARALAESAAKHLPKPVVVINRVGGGGTVGFSEIVGARPDGYNIGLAGLNALSVSPFTVAGLPYKDVNDITPLTGLARTTLVFAVGAQTPYKNLAELFEAAKKAPGTIRFMHAGTGTVMYVLMRLLEAQSGIRFALVPAPDGAILGVLGGHAEAVLEAPLVVLPHAAANKVRVLGSISDTRGAALPNVPTLKEMGIDLSADIYFYLFAPKGTPATVVATLNKAFAQALAEPAFKNFLSAQTLGQFDISGAQLTQRIADDSARFKAVLSPAK